MTKGLKLKSNKKISIKEELVEYTQPKVVYIPLINYGIECLSLVKEGDLVLKGSIIGKRNDNSNFPIASSVSGKVIGIQEKLYLNGKKVNCIAIENDLEERTLSLHNAKKLDSYSKEDFIDLLKKCCVTGMDGSDFPTYIKYQSSIKTLLINAVECEPYITSDYMMIKTHPLELLQTIDAIMNINNIENCVIAIKKHNDSSKYLRSLLKRYPKISIKNVKDIYPMGWERLLIKEVFNKSYVRLPIEEGIIVNNISTIYSIYIALKYQEPIDRRIVTITGEGINKPRNILIKIGTPIKEVLSFYNLYKSLDKIRLIAGGPMMGEALSNDDVMVTKNLNSILVIPDTNDEELPCLRCGKCSDICPVKLCPVLIKDNLTSPKVLKDLQAQRCISCGLCSYVCPSKIRIRESVITASKIVKEAKK